MERWALPLVKCGCYNGVPGLRHAGNYSVREAWTGGKAGNRRIREVNQYVRTGRDKGKNENQHTGAQALSGGHAQ